MTFGSSNGVYDAGGIAGEEEAEGEPKLEEWVDAQACVICCLWS